MPETGTADVRTCIDLYATLWAAYRTRPFAVEEAARTLIDRDEYEYVAGEDEPETHLEQLVEYGLLNREADGYRVAVPPDDVAGELTDESVRREAVRYLVTSSVDADSTDSDRGRTLSREGETYAAVELDPEDAVDSGVERVRDAADGGHRGVAVVTPGTNADAAQKIADRLTEGAGDWEKAGSNVVQGDGADEELVFRLYLDAPPEG